MFTTEIEYKLTTLKESYSTAKDRLLPLRSLGKSVIDYSRLKIDWRRVSKGSHMTYNLTQENSSAFVMVIPARQSAENVSLPSFTNVTSLACLLS